MNDIFSMIDLMSEFPAVDTSRMGIEGWSRGGMMACLALRRTHRFRAAIVVGGLSDLERMAADYKLEVDTRTGFVTLDLRRISELDTEDVARLEAKLGSPELHVPVTHAKIFGWYDNVYGSYTNLLGDLTVHVHETLN